MRKIFVLLAFFFLLLPTVANAQGWEYGQLYFNEQTGHSSWDGAGPFTGKSRVELWQHLGLHDAKNPRMVSMSEVLSCFGRKGWELVSSQESRTGSVYRFKRRIGKK